MLPHLQLLTRDDIPVFVRLGIFGIDDRGEAVFGGERNWIIFWKMIAAAPLVGFGFVYEKGYAWLGGGGVEVSHGALGYHWAVFS